MKIISFIFARGGSLGLKNKNLLKFKNTSLLGNAILQSRKSRYISRTFVSSDSKIILEKSKKLGSKIIKRSKNLSLKNTPASKVILDAIKTIKKKILKDFIIIYLQPTSPFRNHRHINKAIRYLKRSKSKSIISVTRNIKTIYKSVKIKNGLINPIFKVALLLKVNNF